jgi:hypothetical protein
MPWGPKEGQKSRKTGTLPGFPLCDFYPKRFAMTSSGRISFPRQKNPRRTRITMQPSSSAKLAGS